MKDHADWSLHTPLQLKLWLPLARFVSKGLLFVLGPVEIKGAYRVPKSGPVLVLANHLADIDPIVLQTACPRALHCMAKSELFSMPFIGRMQGAFGSFPVVKGTPDRAALKHAISLLADGEAVGIYPEGQLSEDGNLQDLKAGVAIIIRQSPGIPVICCGLNGTNKIIPYGKIIPRPAFQRVTAIWGEPRTFEKSSTTEDILSWIRSQLLELST